MELPNQNEPQIEISTPKTDEKSVGPAIGIIIIIIIIVLGGLYFWGQRIERQKQLQQKLPEQSSSTNFVPERTSNLQINYRNINS